MRLGPEINAPAYNLGHAWCYLQALVWQGLPAMLGGAEPTPRARGPL